MRTSRCIYVNCFSRLRFLADVSTKLHKIAQFKDYNLERKHINRQMTLSFSSTFSTLTVSIKDAIKSTLNGPFLGFPTPYIILSNKAAYFHKVAKFSPLNLNICL